MKTLTSLLVPAFVAAIACWGCEHDPRETVDPHALSQTPAVSDCGGFAELREADGPGRSYCDAEVLSWAYDAETETLELADARALLNCCGDHAIEMAVVDGVYVLTETDAPEGGAGRCDCLCVFDFSLSVAGIPSGPLPFRFERLVTDASPGPRVLFEGTLDLAASAGEELIDAESAEPWCARGEEPPAEISFDDAVSDCGGFEPAEEMDSDGGDYCDAQVLSWTYDAAAGVLDLVDSRILLNCCGEHAMAAEVVDGTLMVTETDAPHGAGGRCDCMCVFDYAIAIDGISEGTLSLRLVLDVTDGARAAVTWEGDLDLAAGAGEIVVSDEDVGMWCPTA